MKKTLLSLIFPIINTVVSIVFICGNLYFAYSLICAAAGGILPIILILAFKTDTGKYIKDVLYFGVLSIAAFFVSSIMFAFLALDRVIVIVSIVLAAAVLISDMYFGTITDDKKERAVLFLSNPIMYFAAFALCTMIDVDTNFLKL